MLVGSLLWVLTVFVSGSDAVDMTPAQLRDRLREFGSRADAMVLAEDLRSWFGKEELLKGARPKVAELDVAWGIEVPGASGAIQVLSDAGQTICALTRIGATDVYAGVEAMPNGFAARWAYAVDGKPVGEYRQLEVYRTDPDSRERDGVPRGTLTKMPSWKSAVFEGTTRDWWVYVPAQYDETKPACVMIFQDGQWYQEFVPTVFDNLIADGNMPVTVAIFLAPGQFENGRSNRSFEYDTLSDQYARFLLEEILPEVSETVKLRNDAAGRAIAGISSGGICAFTAAWERPEAFSKVLSWVGSFTNIASGPTMREGGHNYPALIRKTPKKPIRVYLQGGARDLDNEHGNWPLANQQMAKALAFRGYDHRFVFGEGFHSNAHGKAIFPESLKWLWRDED